MVTLMLTATSVLHTAGLHQVIVSIYRVGLQCICTTVVVSKLLVYHKPRSWLVGFNPMHCWYCQREKLISQQSAVVGIGSYVV